MEHFLTLLGYSSKTIVSIFLIAGAGTVLARKKILTKETVQLLSKIVFTVMLPCLLFTKVAESVTISKLKELWLLPVSCILYIFVGLFLGYITARIFKPRKELFTGVVATNGFMNSGFMPIPIIIAVCSVFPVFAARPESANLGVTYISIFLLGFSPLIWTLGYHILSGKSQKKIQFSNIITPPVIGMGIGLAVGLISPLKNLICNDTGQLNFIFNAASLASEGTVPCAMLILGSMFAKGPASGVVSKRTITTIGFSKLILMPLLAFIYVFFLRKTNIIPLDPLFAIVLIVEAAVPPASNLVVISSLTKNGQEEAISTIMFWTYLASIFTITFFLALALELFV